MEIALLVICKDDMMVDVDEIEPPKFKKKKYKSYKKGFSRKYKKWKKSK
jgi:hypothetical protein